MFAAAFPEACNFPRGLGVFRASFFNAMKTLLNLAFLAALGAFLFSPLSLELSLSLLFAIGLGTITIADYTGTRAARWRTAPLAQASTNARPSAFRLAA